MAYYHIIIYSVTDVKTKLPRARQITEMKNVMFAAIQLLYFP